MRNREQLIAVALLALALPRLGDALAELPGRPVLEALEAGRPVSRQALEILADSAARVDGPDARRAEAAALLRLGDERAAAVLVAGLARSPADPYGWLRLAHADPAQAPRALALSLRTGRWERDLALDRLSVAADHFSALDAATRREILEQVRWLWRLDAPALMRALPPPAHWPLYRRALSGPALETVAARVGMD
ncbi:hypothetical protein ACM64Y_07465 [Novispirillum sp. DQ9]|uniref:hypothetical protein n=1 Tax=Novispirillum sp. DQ9 TaxID=3398612 RepID=UPI003C7D2C51